MMTTASDVVNADGIQEHRCLRHRRGPGGSGPRAGSGPGLRRHHGRLPGVHPGHGHRPRHAGLGTTQPRDMNVPSFSLGNLAGKIEVTRTLTALTPGVYSAKANVPGIKVSVTPAVLNFSAAGEKRTFKVSFENQERSPGQVRHGFADLAGRQQERGLADRGPSAVGRGRQDVAFTSEGGNGSGDISVVSGTNSPDQHDARRPVEGGLLGRRAGPRARSRARPMPRTSSRRSTSRPVPRWPSSRSFPRTRTPTSTCTS